MIFVYDINDPSTFETTPGHFSDACRYNNSKSSKKPLQILVGNKADLNREVTNEKGQVCNLLNLVNFRKTYAIYYS